LTSERGEYAGQAIKFTLNIMKTLEVAGEMFVTHFQLHDTVCTFQVILRITTYSSIWVQQETECFL
jgi:hypothetical protein